MNIAKMMKQAQQMQKRMGEMQAELAAREVQASVAGGKVSVTANGAVVDPEDVELLEDLVLSAVKQAIEQGKALTQQEMSKLTAGLGLPPGMGL
jgi:DNA-binding YbaB/EbfC family protein